MTHVGIDLEQFVTDPYGSGIQRVLQQLATHWPTEVVAANFVTPHAGGYVLLSPQQASSLVGEAFTSIQSGDLRARVRHHVEVLAMTAPQVGAGDLLAMHSAWLLPEVSYLPTVLERFRIFSESMPTAMIGYDALPMTDPDNYRFVPGRSETVSEYFRLLATCDRVVCISDYARDALWARLRRPLHLVTRVASPGGDHVRSARAPSGDDERDVVDRPVRLLRVGTLEDRKRPREILGAFRDARAAGLQAELTFAGAPSSSDDGINEQLMRAVVDDIGVTWVQRASDDEVRGLMQEADAFLSLGTEGFGIPILESLALGTPVIFAGIQPAGRLMEGRGAVALSDDSGDALLTFLLREDLPGRLSAVRKSISLDSMPTWSSFAREVAEAVCP